MNEIEHVILTIDVASCTVTVIGVFLLVGDHGLFADEMLKAVGVSTLDLHLGRMECGSEEVGRGENLEDFK